MLISIPYEPGTDTDTPGILYLDLIWIGTACQQLHAQSNGTGKENPDTYSGISREQDRCQFVYFCKRLIVLRPNLEM